MFACIRAALGLTYLWKLWICLAVDFLSVPLISHGTWICAFKPFDVSYSHLVWTNWSRMRETVLFSKMHLSWQNSSRYARWLYIFVLIVDFMSLETFHSVSFFVQTIILDCFSGKYVTPTGHSSAFTYIKTIFWPHWRSLDLEDLGRQLESRCETFDFKWHESMILQLTS